MTFKELLIATAIKEWEFFGKQEILKYEKDQGKLIPIFKTMGHLEDEEGYYQRVGIYWSEALNANHNGKDNIAWSAAFISYLMKKAKAGTFFRYSEQHSKYIKKAIDAKKQNDTNYGFYGFRLTEYKPEVGDLVCYVREDAVGEIDYDSNRNDYPSHCDLVVEKTGNVLKVIGGNVLDSVSMKHLVLDNNGYLIDTAKPWFAILHNRIALEDRTEIPATVGQLYRCIGNEVNIRRTPDKLSDNRVGALNEGDIVTVLEHAPDNQWRRIQFDNTIGWTSAIYLQPYEAIISNDKHTEILKIVAQSGVSKLNWKDRGHAKPGYYEGMALVFARVYCKLKNGDAAANEMAKAVTADIETDSLSRCAAQFAELGWDNSKAGADTLRHLFVLMYGLGMRESSGQHCIGLDTTEGNVQAETCEAGLFQTSYNARKASALLPNIYAAYKANPNDGFLDVFSKNITCSVADWKNHGEGEGKKFQELSKLNPAFAAEFTAVAMRNTFRHWAPIRDRKAELKTELNAMLIKVQQYIDQNNIVEI